MSRAAAFFDLDKTLMAGSSGMQFARVAARHKLVSRRQLASWGFEHMQYRLRGTTDERTREVLKAARELIAGVPARSFERMNPEVMAAILPRVYPQMLRVAYQHQDAGRRVYIATASSQEKLDLAASLGADVGVLLEADVTSHDVAHRLKEANGGHRVDTVFEMVGGTTFDGSLHALAPFGRLVTFGMASRTPPTPVTPSALMVGSHSVIGFWLMDCMRADKVYAMVGAPLHELVAEVASGLLTPLAGHTYALSHARQAHEDMRARRTTGKVVLDPRLDEVHA